MPVYNGAPFLRECIESVIAQTYSCWQCLVLDNASTDGSGDIALEYARRDPRIRVERNTTLLPVIRNHNRAISLCPAGADYYKPLMADDWLFPECIEKLVAAAEAEPAVGLVCSLAFDGRRVWWDGLPWPARRVPGRTIGRLTLLEGLYVFGTPTSTLLRGDLVRQRERFYNEAHLHADFEVGMELLTQSDLAFVHQVLSFNRIHEAQQTTGAERIESIMAANTYMFFRYGPHYLTTEEFAQRRERRLRDYYAAVARAILRIRNRTVLEYHRNYMNLAGIPLDRWRLVRAVAARTLWHLARPVSLLRSLPSARQ